MQLEEAQALYKNCTIKERGYHADEDIQFLYRSELEKKKKIICLIKGVPYLVPDTIHSTLRDYALADSNKPTLPEDVKFIPLQERFKVPKKYLVDYSPKQVNITPIEIAPVANLVIESNVLIETSPQVKESETDSILRMAREIAEKYNNLDEPYLIPELVGASTIRNFALGNAELLFSQYLQTQEMSTMVNLIANLLISYKHK